MSPSSASTVTRRTDGSAIMVAVCSDVGLVRLSDTPVVFTGRIGNVALITGLSVLV